MLFTNDRLQLRKIFFDTWQKSQSGQMLTALETQLNQIILMHPEYHAVFQQPDKYLYRDYLPEIGETNPFLHLSLHMSLLEQIATDRPPAIAQLYQSLAKHLGDTHVALHQMMDCLAQGLWKMQQGELYSEQTYLEDIAKLLFKK